ncbi:MAG: MbnH family di-heme enzyme [Alcanivoracaceae bacterium]|jgi:cytochrome c peroxidase|nr:MbnH family di-heme enzyme [Alcanivoracaceae bacterium]
MRWRLLIPLLLPLLSGCPESTTTIDDDGALRSDFDWQVRAGIPLPVEPVDNAMSEAKFQLGRHLFYDPRLSSNETISCSSCHHQDKAFADGRVAPRGATGELHPRNSQALVNIAYNPTLTWGNPSLRTIEQQIVIPLFGETPIEHGISDANQELILNRILSEPVYAPLFSAAFPDQPISYDTIVKGLASFIRGMTSFSSDFDRYEQGDGSALSESAKNGMALFFSEQLECFHCHGGYNFTDSVQDRTMFLVDRPFHNTGLYNIDGLGAYPEPNTGVHEITSRPQDMGRFRAPSLRNIAVTAPYMHDGSVATLEDAIRNYAAGGRNLTAGPNAGDGRMNPYKDGFISGFSITDDEINDLIAFLQSLTDDQFLNSERFADPWATP